MNGYSQEGINSLNMKGDLRFICLDGAHILGALQPGMTFSAILDAVWTHAGQTGEAYMPIAKLSAT